MISIVTSLYKSELHLPYFLRNAKKVHSDFKNRNVVFEHILIANDYSEEEKNFIENSGLNFKIISVPRETLYASWNRGTRESTYKHITFWSVDDIRFTKAFVKGEEKLAEGFHATYFPYIYKRYTYLFGIKILIMIKIINQINYDRNLFKVGMYAGPHFMFTKEAFDINGKFDETFKIAGDFDWWSRAAKNNLKIAKNNTLSGVFNNDGRTLSGSKNNLQKKENSIVINRR